MSVTKSADLSGPTLVSRASADALAAMTVARTSTAVLRAADVRFVRGGVDLVEPFSLVLAPGESATLRQPSAFAASLAARLCAAIVRPTYGSILIDDYETRLQPPQAKRRVGFVDAAGFAGDAHAFACEVAFRAECWNLDRRSARERADRVLAALATVDARDDAPPDEPYARAVALALLADVSLVVLDRPQARSLARLRSVVGDASLLATRVGDETDGDARERPAAERP